MNHLKQKLNQLENQTFCLKCMADGMAKAIKKYDGHKEIKDIAKS